MLHRKLTHSLREATSRMVAVLGTSGAVPTTFVSADGIISIASAGSGVYTVTLQRGAPTLVDLDVKVKQASYSASGAQRAVLTTDNVAGSTPTVVFTTVNSAGTATQPATGDKLFIEVTVKL